MTSTALAPIAVLKQELEGRSKLYESMLPAGYRPDRLITGAMLAVSKMPDLLKCSPVSIAVALGQVAQLGLDVGITAHLVPFKGACTMIPDYKGYIELMCKAGARKVEASVVRQGEHFEYEKGTNPRISHKPLGSTAPITHAYAIVWLRGGNDFQFEVMTAEEIEKIRAKSMQWARGELPEWYARKTVIRRVAKYVPKNPALAQLLAVDTPEPTVIDGATGEVLDAGYPAADIGDPGT